jgi:CRISPR-associated exonuclease Cas4
MRDAPVDSVTDDELLPISALNDYLFCERRCALHRTEQIWADNQYTLEGSAAHRKVHAEPSPSELRASGRVVRRMWLRSDRLRLVGMADLVEFGERPFPVEYKRGPRRKWDNDDVQLCAQALCLEEMLGVVVPAGAVFHVRTRRRREVVFTSQLRELTGRIAMQVQALIQGGQTPPPVLKSRCRGCSLREQCFPELLGSPERARAYLRSLYRPADDSPPPSNS